MYDKNKQYFWKKFRELLWNRFKHVHTRTRTNLRTRPGFEITPTTQSGIDSDAAESWEQRRLDLFE